jgi:DNA recombination protein RmuC
MNQYLMPSLVLLGVTIGALLSWLIGRGRARAQAEAAASYVAKLEREVAGLNQQLRASVDNFFRLSHEAGEKKGLVTQLSDDLVRERRERDVEKRAREAAEAEVSRLNGELKTMGVRLETAVEDADKQLATLSKAKAELTETFKNLANEILEEKSKRFTDQNQTNLGQLLQPLKAQLTDFKAKVEDVHEKEVQGRSELAEQVRHLMALNQTMSSDANNLTKALKGDSKVQGDWGELILERVLEASGLREGQYYIAQDSQMREDGSRARPDFVIALPEERWLVVDSKVSLLAYANHVAAETEAERDNAMRQHLDSIRRHIKGLAEKQYQTLYGLKSLDFVMMFVPIEPAFILAVTHDAELFMDALRKKVLLVSPSTLLFVVKTVHLLWQQEGQSRNTQEIAKQGGLLYNKLVDFVEDLKLVGVRIGRAQTAFQAARTKLIGNQGAIKHANKLKGLGVTPTKEFPASFVELSGGENDSDDVTTSEDAESAASDATSMDGEDAKENSSASFETATLGGLSTDSDEANDSTTANGDEVRSGASANVAQRRMLEEALENQRRNSGL